MVDCRVAQGIDKICLEYLGVPENKDMCVIEDTSEGAK